MTISTGPRSHLNLFDIPGKPVNCNGTEAPKAHTVGGSAHQLSDEARAYTCHRLNQLLADTQVLHSYFQKYHRLMRHESTYQIHLLLGKFAAEQNSLTEVLSERIQNLGGIPVADPRHIAELARIPRVPNCAEQIPAMLSRLLNATELILIDAYMAATQIGEFGGTNIDPSISELVRIDEIHARFLCQLIDKHSAHIHVAWTDTKEP